MKAPLPANEKGRLALLRRYGVLDTPPEAAFDDLALLAAQICQVPIALVSLVDERRQWFKAGIGLTAPETSRDIAFCAHTLLHQDEILEVRDALTDPRFADNPLVTKDPNIRFYAGAPLVAPGGHALGALCVMDRAPRQLTPEQTNALRALSRLVVNELELRRQAGQVRSEIAERKRAEAQLLLQNGELARGAQESVRQLALAGESRNALLSMLEDRQLAIRNLSASEERFRRLVDGIQDYALFMLDPEGRVVSWNSGAQRLKGYAADEIVGQHFSRFYPEEAVRAGFPARELAEATAQGRYEDEGWRVRKDGSRFWANVTITALRDEAGALRGFSRVTRDMTERKRAVDEIRALNADLERRVRERTVELGIANAELARASRLKDEFLANMSHELRTPLNAILGLSEALLEQTGGALTPRQLKSITTIFTSGQHLLALINDILDLSKIEAGKLELHGETLHLREFCESCLVFVRQQATAKQITVAFESDGCATEFVADPKRFKQVLVNLLTNAVKFTPVGGSVGLSVAAPLNEEVLRFTVWDTGIGITSADSARLFNSFVQVDSGLNRAQDGTGLGLALVAKLTELHGGSIALESVPGRGSRFIVILPLSAAPPAPSKRRSRVPFKGVPATAAPIRRALVIEDDPSTVEQLRRYLTELSIECLLPPHGADPVAVALRERPDAILLDIQLPVESGWVVLAKLKENPGTRDIPVAVISVVDDPENSEVLGATAHFTKPITRAQLAGFLKRTAVEVTRSDPPFIEPTTAGGPVILLAEDNEANLQTIGGYLEDKGYALHYARNGVDAVRLARDLRPALILMDVQMPVMDGLTATREIRADASLQGIPIVVLTALAMAGDRERCLAVGASEYLSKPVSLKALATLVKQLLADKEIGKQPALSA